MLMQYSEAHLPARISNLATGLADYRSKKVSTKIVKEFKDAVWKRCGTRRELLTVDGDDFSHVDLS